MDTNPANMQSGVSAAPQDSPKSGASGGIFKKISEAIVNVAYVSKNLEALKTENKELRDQVFQLGKAVSYLTGQLSEIDNDYNPNCD